MKYKLDYIKENPQILINNNIDPQVFFKAFDNEVVTKDLHEVQVSFIIASKNRYKMLMQAITSILRLDFSNFEIIVVDDASSQKDYKNLDTIPFIRIFHNKTSLGPGLSRKLAYNKAQGSYIIFMDDDDFYTSNHLIKRAINKLKEDKSLSFCAFNTLTFYEEDKSILFSRLNIKGHIKKEDYFINFINKFQKPTSTFPTIFKKEYLDKADFKNMDMMNDTSIYLRALTQGDAYIFDDYIGVYRVHASNISKSLDIDFIKKNIDEKYNIYLMAKDTFDIDLKTWLFNQVSDTLRYYIVDTKGKYENVKKLITYISEVCSIKKIDLYRVYLKALIIRLLIKFR